MKKSHENWNDYLTESTDYPEELYQATDRLELRIRKEKRKKRLLFSSIPTTAAALLFVILMNTSVVFARTMADIPILSKISELVMYNESLKSAVENRNIQYVNLKAENGDLELKLPYVIADSKNLVLFLEIPENLELSENERYHINIDHLRDLSTDDFIASGFLSFSGSYTKGQDPLLSVSMEFVDRNLPGYPEVKELPKEFTLSLSLTRYSNEDQYLQRPLSIDSFQFDLTLDEFRKPVTYPLNEEIIIEGQKILFKEMVSYPVRSEITFEFSEENDADMNLRLSLLEDGIKTSLGSYAYLSQTVDGTKTETIHIRSDYFDPPKSRSISIDRYTIIREEEREIRVDLDARTLTPETEGIELTDVERMDGELIFTFKTSERYPYSPFAFISDQGHNVEILKEAYRSTDTEQFHLYHIEDGDYEELEFLLSSGPEYTLEEPILIPIPVGN